MTPKKKAEVSEKSGKRKEMENRREQVRNLYFIRRYTQREVAEALKVNLRTIERDTAFIRQAFMKEVKKHTAEKLITKTLSQNDEIINQAWDRYNKTKSSRNKIAALNLIHKVETENINVFQQLGLIDKVAEKSDVKTDIKIKWLKPEEWKREGKK